MKSVLLGLELKWIWNSGWGYSIRWRFASFPLDTVFHIGREIGDWVVPVFSHHPGWGSRHLKKPSWAFKPQHISLRTGTTCSCCALPQFLLCRILRIQMAGCSLQQLGVVCYTTADTQGVLWLAEPLPGYFETRSYWFTSPNLRSCTCFAGFPDSI